MTERTQTTVDEVEHLRAQVAALSAIVQAAWNCSRDGCDYDGGSIQDDMVKAGLLVSRSATEAEADECDCEPGDELFFPSDLMKGPAP